MTSGTGAAHRLPSRVLDKIWGTADTAPWLDSGGRPVGEVWFEPQTMPLLIKFIFTSERLSVQVHPGGDTGKTEMWHILRAGEGANLAVGVNEEISLEYLRIAAGDGSIEQLLRWIPVQPGETYFIPAGTIHAIGANVALCEIQQKSDVTFRLYDYGRPRELHLEQALDVAITSPWWPHHPQSNARRPWRRLVECRHFITEVTDTAEPFDCEPSAVVVLAGNGTIAGQPCTTGECWEIIAGPVRIEPHPGSRLLRTKPAKPGTVHSITN